MVDRCVICGEPVPEGRQVCWGCIEKTIKSRPSDLVVRCRECVFSRWNPCNHTLRCNTYNGMGLRVVDENDYCSYGERKLQV